MALGGFYREVWKDEELRRNKITQNQVIMIVDAVGRTIKRLVKEKGILKWQGVFTLKTSNIKGWKTTSIKDNEEHVVKDFKRIYIKPSKDFKECINNDD